MDAVETFADVLREQFKPFLATTPGAPPPSETQGAGSITRPEESIDVMGEGDARAIEALRANHTLMAQIALPKGVAWGVIMGALKDALPPNMDDRDRHAFDLVARALNAVCGSGTWTTLKAPNKNGDKQITYVTTHKA